MEIKKIDKERIGDYPMCPRAEYKAIDKDGEEYGKDEFLPRKVHVVMLLAVGGLAMGRR